MIEYDKDGTPRFAECATHAYGLLELRVKSNGSQEYGHHCQECCKWMAVKKQSISETERLAAIPFDESCWKRRSEALSAAHREQRVKRDTAWWGAYDEYLKSIKWKEKRRAALERDNGICQGCLERSASQVHHEKYPPQEFFGHEPLYWLVSLCDSCHISTHLILEALAGKPIV